MEKKNCIEFSNDILKYFPSSLFNHCKNKFNEDLKDEKYQSTNDQLYNKVNICQKNMTENGVSDCVNDLVNNKTCYEFEELDNDILTYCKKLNENMEDKKFQITAIKDQIDKKMDYCKNFKDILKCKAPNKETCNQFASSYDKFYRVSKECTEFTKKKCIEDKKSEYGKYVSKLFDDTKGYKILDIFEDDIYTQGKEIKFMAENFIFEGLFFIFPGEDSVYFEAKKSRSSDYKIGLINKILNTPLQYGLLIGKIFKLSNGDIKGDLIDEGVFLSSDFEDYYVLHSDKTNKTIKDSEKVLKLEFLNQ